MEILFTKPSGEDAIISVDASIEETHNSSALVTEHAVEEDTNISDHVRPENDRFSVEMMITNHPIRQPGSHADGATSAFSSAILFATTPLRRNTGNPILTNPGSPPRTVRDLTKGISVAAAAGGAPAEIGVGLTVGGSVKIPGIPPTFEPQPLIPEAGADGPDATVLQFSQEFNRVRAVYEELRGILRTGTIVKIVTSLRTYENMIFENMSTPRNVNNSESVRLTLEAVQVRIVSTDTVEITEPLQTRGEKNRKRGNQRTEEDKAPERSQTSKSGWKKLSAGGLDLLAGR